jgi:hypothetical protein
MPGNGGGVFPEGGPGGALNTLRFLAKSLAAKFATRPSSKIKWSYVPKLSEIISIVSLRL